MDYDPNAKLDDSQVTDDRSATRSAGSAERHLATPQLSDRDYAHPDDWDERGGFREQFDVPNATQPTTAPAPASFSAPTARPAEPITQGVDIGPGAGSSSWSAPVQAQMPKATPLTDILRAYSATAANGSLAQLYQAAMTRGV